MCSLVHNNMELVKRTVSGEGVRFFIGTRAGQLRLTLGGSNMFKSNWRELNQHLDQRDRRNREIKADRRERLEDNTSDMMVESRRAR